MRVTYYLFLLRFKTVGTDASVRISPTCTPYSNAELPLVNMIGQKPTSPRQSLPISRFENSEHRQPS